MQANTEKPIVLGIGEILWDMLPGGKQPGGAPINFAYHAQQLGARSYPISAVGNDSLGIELLNHLKGSGISIEYIARVCLPTGTVDVGVDGDGIPNYAIREGVAWDSVEQTPELMKLAPNACAVCFGTLAQRSEISRNTIVSLLKCLPTQCLKVFDINLRQHYYSYDVITNSLEQCDILKINDEELTVITNLLNLPPSEEDALMALMGQYQLKLIALTSGDKGSLLVNPLVKSYLPTPRVTVSDTVGAGDAFTAAVVMGYIRMLPLAEIHRLAVDLSAYVCTQRGAMPIVPPELRLILGS